MSSAAALFQLKPASRQSLGQSVADSLRDAIYAGRFRSGQRIGQASVARELGVSQTTVRDALATLEHEGLVERQLNQGAVVTQLSREDIEEITTLRINLEAMAVRRLIRQGNPEHSQALEENIQSMKGAAAPAQVADIDLQFHELLLRLAGHKRLLSCWETLRTQIKLLMVTHNLRDPRSAKNTMENHQQLVELIRARDEAGAVAHLEQANVAHLLHATNEDWLPVG